MSKHTFVAFGIVALVAAAPVAVLTPAGARAATTTGSASQATPNGMVTIPVNTYGKGTPGSEKLLVSKTVPNGDYKIKATSHNQESVHPNTDLIIRTSGSEGVISDVESKPFKEYTTAESTLSVTDGKVDVLVRFGADGVFSGGMTVTLIPVTPEEPETPVVPVTPTTPQQPAAPQKPAETPKPETPAELPATGSGGIAAMAAGLGIAGYAAHLWVSSKRRLSRFGR